MLLQLLFLAVSIVTGCQVKLRKHAYSDAEVCYVNAGQEMYNMDMYNGCWSDEVSQVVLPAKCRVDLYKDHWYNGDHIAFINTDTHDMTFNVGDPSSFTGADGVAWSSFQNDAYTSVRADNYPDCPGLFKPFQIRGQCEECRVTFSEHSCAHCGKWCHHKIGETDQYHLGSGCPYDGDVSHIKIEGNCRAVIETNYGQYTYQGPGSFCATGPQDGCSSTYFTNDDIKGWSIVAGGSRSVDDGARSVETGTKERLRELLEVLHLTARKP